MGTADQPRHGMQGGEIPKATIAGTDSSRAASLNRISPGVNDLAVLFYELLFLALVVIGTILGAKLLLVAGNFVVLQLFPTLAQANGGSLRHASLTLASGIGVYAGLFSFIVGVSVLMYLIATFPYKRDWLAQKTFTRRVWEVQIFAVLMLYATNVLPTVLIERIYTTRVLVTYVSALLAVLHCAVYFYFVPKPLLAAMGNAESPGEIPENLRGLLMARPYIRNLLAITAATSCAIFVWLILTLMPNSLSTANLDLKKILWPF